MKRTITFLSLFFFFSLTILNAQNDLKVINPNWGWGGSGYLGTIEEASFQIEPKGLYMEVGMFLTLSAQGTPLVSDDNLEIILDFNLPSGAIVHDSWLWMNDTLIVQADIFDVSQATEIYEDIVDRNLDPSLLYRRDNGTYQLRIFPLAANSSRKVKVTFLTPAIWADDKVESWLPLEILRKSNIPLSEFNLISLGDENWGEPSLAGADDIIFTSGTDPVMGDVWVTNVPEVIFDQPVKFSLDSPMNDDGVYVNTFEDIEEEKFYQVAYLPPALPVSSDPKNVAVVFDHDISNSHISKTAIFDFTKEQLAANLTAEDKLNIFYSDDGQAESISLGWISCDSAFLAQLFANFEDPIDAQSNFVDVMTFAIEFINQNEGEGDIIFITNSSQSFWYENQIENWLEMIGANDIRINIVNYQSLNYYWNDQWNAPDELYYPHIDLYTDLALLTGGFVYSSLDGGISTWEAISSSISDLKNADYSFDMDIDVTSGFTYEQYFQTYQGQSVNLNQPILQVGKYHGDFPMTLEFSAYNDGVFTFDTKTIDILDVVEADTLNREIWTGHKLRALEGSASNNSDVQNIVELSLAERVLSKYTAFLALELAQGGEPCLNCWYFDEVIIATEEPASKDAQFILTASPNPLSDYSVITLELTGDENPDYIIAQLFDAYGNLVKEIPVNDLLSLGSLQYTWDGKDANGRSLPSGIYHLVVQTEKGVQSIKLSVIR